MFAIRHSKKARVLLIIVAAVLLVAGLVAERWVRDTAVQKLVDVAIPGPKPNCSQSQEWNVVEWNQEPAIEGGVLTLHGRLPDGAQLRDPHLLVEIDGRTVVYPAFMLMRVRGPDDTELVASIWPPDMPVHEWPSREAPDLAAEEDGYAVGDGRFFLRVKVPPSALSGDGQMMVSVWPPLADGTTSDNWNEPIGFACI